MHGFRLSDARAVNVMKEAHAIVGTAKARNYISHKKKFGMDVRVFRNKDDPDYKFSYGTTYTERQLKILTGEIDIFSIKANEIKFIIKKAEGIGDCETCKKAKELYELRTHQEEYHIDMSPEEARNILQTLTPWKINWEKK